MECFEIAGGARLSGKVRASGAKNAALPIMAASILADGPVRLLGVPHLVDVDTQSLVLGQLGVEVTRQTDDAIQICTVDDQPTRADYDLVRRMRASFCVLGPLVARRGKGVVSLPGGCNIGTRPVDLHLAGLAALGAEVRTEHGYVVAEAERLRGAELQLRGPHGPTVTGTANLLTAATMAEGRSVLIGAATEPEVVDLGNFLISLGADIRGLGSDTIEVHGVDYLAGGEYRIIPDRIEAATLLVAVAITGGAATITGVLPGHLDAVLRTLASAGASLNVGPDWIWISAPQRPRPVDVAALPFPGVPTDVQAQLMALLSLSSGASLVRDNVFPDRFMHVAELNRLGARIERNGAVATVQGVTQLTGATVMASDLRASAALVLAGLAAEGQTTVRRIYHLDRGYEQLEVKLMRLGAKVVRRAEAEHAASDVAKRHSQVGCG